MYISVTNSHKDKTRHYTIKYLIYFYKTAEQIPKGVIKSVIRSTGCTIAIRKRKKNIKPMADITLQSKLKIVNIGVELRILLN
jgi:hypothetical protein